MMSHMARNRCRSSSIVSKLAVQPAAIASARRLVDGVSPFSTRQNTDRAMPSPSRALVDVVDVNACTLAPLIRINPLLTLDGRLKSMASVHPCLLATASSASAGFQPPGHGAGIRMRCGRGKQEMHVNGGARGRGKRERKKERRKKRVGGGWLRTPGRYARRREMINRSSHAVCERYN